MACSSSPNVNKQTLTELPRDKFQLAAASWNFSLGTVLKVIMEKSRSRKVSILRLIQVSVSVSVSKIWKVQSRNQSRSRKSQKKSLVKLSISRFQKFESRSQSRTWDQGRKSLGIGLESENPVFVKMMTRANFYFWAPPSHSQTSKIN